MGPTKMEHTFVMAPDPRAGCAAVGLAIVVLLENDRLHRGVGIVWRPYRNLLDFGTRVDRANEYNTSFIAYLLQHERVAIYIAPPRTGCVSTLVKETTRLFACA